MKYVSIDLETTGLDPERCDILQFGAVIEDTENQLPYDELPTLNLLVGPPHPAGRYSAEVGALVMNAKLIERIQKEGSVKPGDIEPLFFLFVEEHLFKVPNEHVPEVNYPLGERPQINLAGKNFNTFDRHFLDELHWNWSQYHRRVIDPAMLWWRPEEDETLPSTELCMERAGINPSDFGDGELHDAVTDAKIVIALVREGMKRVAGQDDEDVQEWKRIGVAKGARYLLVAGEPPYAVYASEDDVVQLRQDYGKALKKEYDLWPVASDNGGR